jgi:hypothetical protein
MAGEDLLRQDGDWIAHTEADGIHRVSWMPWRQDFGHVEILRVKQARDSRIIASMLKAMDAQPEEIPTLKDNQE